MVGFGDLYPAATLKWNQDVHNFMIYATTSVPVGIYDPTRLASMGLGHWAADTGAGYTYLNEQSSAIAAFDATQVAFAALVKKGILSKAEAEQILMQAIETIKTGGAGDQAAELLAIALEKISKFEPAPRQ